MKKDWICNDTYSEMPSGDRRNEWLDREEAKQKKANFINWLIKFLKVDTNKISDSYHTFNELYEFRKLYNACLFNEWYKQGKYEVHKSTRHSDGEECFGGGWFIVMATLPTGQISNHYEMKDWGLFDCQVRQRADKWDGHTAQDVAKRLLELVKNNEN